MRDDPSTISSEALNPLGLSPSVLEINPVESGARSDNNRFYALDALRGVAALAVVCLHNQGMLGGLPSPAAGWLAVDVFFLLSGFVIAHAYSSRLAGSLTPLSFLQIRLVRLYPLYLLGLAIGLAKLLVQLRVGAHPPLLMTVLTEAGFGLFMLPSPTTIGDKFDPTFPLDLPAWSLFLEIGANLVYAMLAKQLTVAKNVLLVCLCGAALLVIGFAHGSVDVGNTWSTVAAGIPRAMFPFFLGILLYRVPFALPRLGGGWFVITNLALLTALFFRPKEYYLISDLICVFLLFPAIVLIATKVQVSGCTRTACTVAGETSYAVYILHLPVLTLVGVILQRLAPTIAKAAFAGPIFVVVLVFGCLGIDRMYDMPIRRRLSKWVGTPSLPSNHHA